MASQSLGTLYVKLNTDSKAFLSGMAAAAASVKKVANAAKEASEKFASTGTMMLALGGAAVKLASTVDARAARSLAGLEKNSKLLAVQLADVLEPAVKSISSGFRDAANWFGSLDDKTKKSISTFAVWAAGMAVVAKAVGAVAGVLGGLATVVRGIATVLGAIGIGPIIAIVTAVALLAAGIAALHYAFRENLGGIADMWKRFTEWLSGAWNGAVAAMSAVLVGWAQDTIANVRLVVLGFAELMKVMGYTDKAGAAFKLAGDLQGLQFNIKATVAGIVTDAFEVAKKGAQGFVDEWKRIFAEMGLGGFGGGTGARRPGIGPVSAHVGGPTISGAVPFRGPNAVSMGSEFLGSMNELARQNEKHAKELAKAQVLERRAVFDLAQAHIEALKMAHASATGDLTGLSKEQVAQVTKDTGGAWKDLSEAQKTFGNFAGRMADTVLGGLDKAGQAIGSIINGAVQGGVWGAVVAAFMELAKHMASFQRLIGFLNNVFVRVGQMLEPLLKGVLDAVSEILAVVVESLAPIFASLQPLFDAIAAPIKALAPTLGLLGFLFKELGPIIAAIVTMLGVVFHALEPVMRILFEVLRVVLLVIFAVLEAIANIWNGIIEAIATMVQFILNVITLGLAQGWAKDVADQIRKGKADTDAMAASRQQLNDATWDSVNAQNAQTAAAWDAAAANDETAKTAREVADALTNVPSGYKVALARFDAMDAGQRYAAATPGTSAHGGGGSSTVINGDVNINADGQDASEIAARIEDAKRRLAGQRRGNVDDEGI